MMCADNTCLPDGASVASVRLGIVISRTGSAEYRLCRILAVLGIVESKLNGVHAWRDQQATVRLAEPVKLRQIV
jgi:hypothetical protein